MAGLDAKAVIGKSFFREVAPRTDVQEFHGAFKRGVAERKLDTKFGYRFVFKNKDPIDVLIVMHYSSQSETTWVFVQPISS